MSDTNTERGDLGSALKKLCLNDADEQKPHAPESRKLLKSNTSLDEEENFNYFWEDNFVEDKIQELNVHELPGMQKDAIFFTVKPIHKENKISQKTQAILEEFKINISCKDAEDAKVSHTQATHEDAVFYTFKRVTEKNRINRLAESSNVKDEISHKRAD